MNRHFSNVDIFNDELFVVDYTEKTKNTKKKRGVEFQQSRPSDIEGLHIINCNGVEFFAVNFEKNVLTDLLGNNITQCECLCAAKKQDARKGWLLFIELKYCLFNNAVSNFNTAYTQIKSTHQYLLDNKKIPSNYRIYYVISLPNQNNTPFENFKFNPTELAEIKRNTGVTIRGTNAITIRDSIRLKV